jgi:transposase-like protein
VVQQAYVCGVSTRRVDRLVESLGLRISKSEVRRVCAALDEHVDTFCARPLGPLPPTRGRMSLGGHVGSPGTWWWHVSA